MLVLSATDATHLLNVCNGLNVTRARDVTKYVADYEIDLPNILAITPPARTSRRWWKLCITGPRSGTGTNKFYFTDGSRGDVYRCILLAISRTTVDGIAVFRADGSNKIRVHRRRSSRKERDRSMRSDMSIASVDRTVEFDTDADVERSTSPILTGYSTYDARISWRLCPRSFTTSRSETE